MGPAGSADVTPQSSLRSDPGLCPEQFRNTVLTYAEDLQLDATIREQLSSFLSDATTEALVRLDGPALEAFLVNDVYKPRMHKLYAHELAGVSLEWEMHVRKSPIHLTDIERHGFEVDAAMLGQAEAEGTATVDWVIGGGAADKAAMSADPASPRPRDTPDLRSTLAARAAGRGAAASHVETTLTQAVQEVVVAAQVRAFQASHPGLRLPGTLELAAASLARLAGIVGALNAAREAAGGRGDSFPGMALFASRRASSRRFLALQNWYCRRYLAGWRGTSAVAAAAWLLGRGEDPEAVGPLVGTLAHEVVMSVDQLVSGREAELCDKEREGEEGEGAGAGGSEGGELGKGAGGGEGGEPVEGAEGGEGGELGKGAEKGETGDPGALAPRGSLSLAASASLSLAPSISLSLASPAHLPEVGAGPLLAHLLLLRRSGGLAASTALADTYGTPGFVAAALAARLPSRWKEDVKEAFPGDWERAARWLGEPDARVFDLFRFWRLDSGDYVEMAGVIADAWECRWEGTPEEARPPRPRFIHSNLGSCEEVLAACALPLRVRPDICAFGTLADGFPRFLLGAGEPPRVTADLASPPAPSSAALDLSLCSVVMKVVQARHPAVSGGAPCAGKLGDDRVAGKLQLDMRLGAGAQTGVLGRMRRLGRDREVPGPRASRVLARLYEEVAQEGLLR